MLGLLISDGEKEEIIYLLKKEMDEILFDLSDDRLDPIVKESIEERYKKLFILFKRIAKHNDCLNYMLSTNA